MEKAPLMIDWLAITVAIVARPTSDDLEAGRAKRKERVGALARRTIDHDRGLTGIVEHKARQHQAVPGKADRAGPEMAHVGIKRFGSCRAQETLRPDPERPVKPCPKR